MNWGWFRYVCLVISLVFAWTETLSAQWLLSQRKADIEEEILYNESIYIVSNYSAPSSNAPETLSLKELLQKEIEGFYFYLRQDTKTKMLSLRNPDGSFTPFNEALTAIKKNLDAHPEKIMTLFLDFYVYPDLEASFIETGLQDYLVEFDAKEGWPSLKEMVENGKRMIIFEVRPHVNTPTWLHLMSDYVEHTDPDWGNYSEEAIPFDTRLKQNLSLFTGFNRLETTIGNSDDLSAFARQTPYLIESFKRAWIMDGKIPNFILVNKYYDWLNVSLATVRDFHLVFGTVTSNGELLSYVNWAGMSSATTGHFCFPLESQDQLTLSPTSPGYLIEPKTTTATDTGKKIFIGDFSAKPLRIEEDIELYLPLNGDGKDGSSRHNSTFSREVDYLYDPIQGQVGLFEDQARVDLPTATKLQMTDHDFSVSAWVKIPQYIPNKTDYCILGSNNYTYQRSLHLMIRDKKPYMGFYNNDLVGNTLIEPGEWYHIVWRYNKSDSEQAIFVNGKLDAISFFRPAYQGSDSLFVGYMNMGQNTDFIGMLDNLCIWSRVLSDKEILGLSNQLIDLHIASPSPAKGWILGGLILFLLIAAVFYRAYYPKQKRKQATSKGTAPIQASSTPIPSLPTEEHAHLQTHEEASPTRRNYIRLFGEFYVLDRDGKDITTLFTPKLKQLFLLIMLHSSRGGVGICGNDLTRMIWGGDGSAKSTRSLRSVSILKLRKILERIDHIEIVYTANRYVLQVSGDVYCDYLICLDLLKDKRIQSLADFDHFLSIVSEGEPFKGESFEWLDDFKSYICNNTVDVLSNFLKQYSLESEAGKVIQIANQILINDPCNEEALSYKIKALNGQNKFRSAHYAYDRFCALYREMYGEDFLLSFEQMASDNDKHPA